MEKKTDMPCASLAILVEAAEHWRKQCNKDLSTVVEYDSLRRETSGTWILGTTNSPSLICLCTDAEWRWLGREIFFFLVGSTFIPRLWSQHVIAEHNLGCHAGTDINDMNHIVWQLTVSHQRWKTAWEIYIRVSDSECIILMYLYLLLFLFLSHLEFIWCCTIFWRLLLLLSRFKEIAVVLIQNSMVLLYLSPSRSWYISSGRLLTSHSALPSSFSRFHSEHQVVDVQRSGPGLSAWITHGVASFNLHATRQSITAISETEMIYWSKLNHWKVTLNEIATVHKTLYNVILKTSSHSLRYFARSVRVHPALISIGVSVAIDLQGVASRDRIGTRPLVCHNVGEVNHTLAANEAPQAWDMRKNSRIIRQDRMRLACMAHRRACLVQITYSSSPVWPTYWCDHCIHNAWWIYACGHLPFPDHPCPHSFLHHYHHRHNLDQVTSSPRDWRLRFHSGG